MAKKISRKTLFFSIFGLFMWILYYFSSVVVVLKNIEINAFSYDMIYKICGLFFPFPYFENLAVFYYALFGFLYFLAGYQVYKARTSGYFWYLSLGFAHISIGLISFGLFGTFIGIFSVVLNIILGLIILFYFSSESTKNEFGISKKLSEKVKRDIKVFSVICFSMVLFYLIFIASVMNIYPLAAANIKYINNTKVEKTFYNKFNRREFFDYSMDVEQGSILSDAKFDNDELLYVNVINSTKDYGMLFYDYTYFEKITRVIGSKFNINRVDEFIYTILKNKYSIIFQFIKAYKFNKNYNDFYELNTDREDYKIFLFTGNTDKSNYYEYYVYNTVSRKMSGIYFIVFNNKEKYNMEYFNKIILSTKYDENILLDNNILKAKSLIYNAEFEQAKNIILKGIDLDRNNADLYYLLSLCFYNEKNTADYSFTRKFLGKALQLDPEHKNSKILMEKITR